MPAISLAGAINEFLTKTLKIDEDATLRFSYEHSLARNTFFLKINDINHDLFNGSGFGKQQFEAARRLLSIEERATDFHANSKSVEEILFLIGSTELVGRLLKQEKPKEAAIVISIFFQVQENRSKYTSATNNTTITPLKDALNSIRTYILDHTNVSETITCKATYQCDLSKKKFSITIDGVRYPMFEGENINFKYLREAIKKLKPTKAACIPHPSTSNDR